LKKIQLEEEMDEILKERYIEAARQHVVAVQEAGFSYAEDNQLPIGIEGLRLKCPPSWQRVVNIWLEKVKRMLQELALPGEYYWGDDGETEDDGYDVMEIDNDSMDIDSE
jgi:hypothetical protein